MIHLGFWLDLSLPLGHVIPQGKKKADYRSLHTAGLCWNPALARSVGLQLFGWQRVGGGSAERLGGGGACPLVGALCLPIPHLHVVFDLASSRDVEVDLVPDDGRIWHIRGGSTFILCSLHAVDFKTCSGLRRLPSLAR